jgi:dihydroflavonol-4-reductase
MIRGEREAQRVKVLVTGATGFVGSSVVRALLESGYEVRGLARANADLRNVAGLDLELVTGDVRDPASLSSAMVGCQQVYHLAALYSYWWRPRSDFHDINVEGTRNVLRAAQGAGVERAVYTSSVATLGLPEDGSPGTEDTPVTLADMVSDYKRSKFLAEEVARDFADAGLPVVIVNPSTPVGVRDIKPTPTGRTIVDFLNGRMPAYLDTGLNIVDVEDVAQGHLLAAEKGQVGERYILGHENLTLKEILGILADLTGKPAPTTRLPYYPILLLSYVYAGACRALPGSEPQMTPETVRLARKRMFFDSSKAVRELGFPQTPARDAFHKAVDWFSEHGYVRG